MVTYRHESAMLEEALECLACRPGGIFVDGTLGGAGHARTICEKILPGGLFIGIDQDADAIANASERLGSFAENIRLFHGNFDRLPEYLAQLKIDSVHGILLDLGMSQYQLESSGRGFSFQKDEPLDMRMDIRVKTRADDLLNTFKEDQLARIFKDYGEERWAKPIARAVVAQRKRAPIKTSRQLSDLIIKTVRRRPGGRHKIHPATRVFMALRIVVNKELERLKTILPLAVGLLKPGGRLVVLSFHSLEDRLVKQYFKKLATRCICPPGLPICACNHQRQARLITKKAVKPSQDEISRNPMARSTRLRAIEKLSLS
ncbi:MAG: 16S rRNA (cytosine(1402)-N(4))-methyltransferase RsmH [Desulfobacteraceae bacterium]|nr:16S rRNA (cytosine(1402)-N(4))-methyltransferase RsmH [Desulfobacteraceae bacterium]